jgi:hypothetical protein
MSKQSGSNKGFIIYGFAENGDTEKLGNELIGSTVQELNWKAPGNGLTPLLIACQENHPDCVKKLVENEDVDVNAVDTYGRTGLFIAAEFGYPDVVRKLLTRSDINSYKSDNKGKIPLEIAKSYKNIREHIPSFIKSPVEFENYKNIEKQIEDFENSHSKLPKSKSQSHPGITMPTRRLGGRGSISKSKKRRSTNRKYKKNRKTNRSRR